MTDNADGWKEATGNAWKPEKKGESITGILVKVQEKVGPNNSMMYHIEDSESHEIVKVWGSTILDSRMSEVKVGQLVRITFKGLGEKGKGGKQAPKIFKVEFKDVDAFDIAEKQFPE
jgi:hypothetical protein